MLSLPGYSFAEHHARCHGGAPLPDLRRPSRAEASAYFAAYPAAAGISDAVRTGCVVESVSRRPGGFLVQPFGIVCRHLVLASGTDDHEAAPPPPVRPLQSVHVPASPVLVVGSGFSAADAIIATPPTRRILHVYHWAPESRPSPLWGCHRQAYPEYACVYRQMKAAAALGASTAVSPPARKKSDPFSGGRDWASTYEGLPNATVDGVIPGKMCAIVKIPPRGRCHPGATGRGPAVPCRPPGSLAYLDPALWNEVVADPPAAAAAGRGIDTAAAQERRSVAHAAAQGRGGHGGRAGRVRHGQPDGRHFLVRDTRTGRACTPPGASSTARASPPPPPGHAARRTAAGGAVRAATARSGWSTRDMYQDRWQVASQ